MRLITVLVALLPFGLIGCGWGASDACQREAECFQKDCTGTDAYCEELAAGREEACNAERDAWAEATSTGDAAICDECISLRQDLWACLADVSSCDALGNADNQPDGACAAEALPFERDQKCHRDVIEAECWN